MTAQEIQQRLRRLADKEKAQALRGFFKTGPGQYGERDIFLGITVPVLRKVAGESRDLPITDTILLLKSPIHEHRLLALFLLIQAYNQGSQQLKKKIYSLYIKNVRFVNNWDLVDLSAPNIVGNYLADKPRRQLYDFAGSNHVWSRRVAVVSTFRFIRMHYFSDTLQIAHLLINDAHDLVHKAAGWMLREVGKRDRSTLERFLSRYCTQMPRTMLRYAIERFPEASRQEYLKRRAKD